MTLIAPSLLSADFSNLARDIKTAEEGGADLFHLDIMDGVFVPNISFGIPVVKAIRTCTKIPLDTHLMIQRPDKYAQAFIDAGSDIIAAHVESKGHSEAISITRKAAKKSCLVLNPGTPFKKARKLMPNLDYILIMTVNPGFAAQSFMEDVLPKISETKEYIEKEDLDTIIAVDGGIKPSTIGKAAAAGGQLFVAGSSVFKGSGSIAENISELRKMGKN